MSSPQSHKTSLTIGILVTLILMERLFSSIVDWKTENYTTLIAVISDPSLTMFVIYFSVLMFCIWLIRGPNNKSIYLFWCLGYMAHYFLYWSGLETFLNDEANRNIYVLNWLATVCVIPLLLLCRYRSYYSIFVIAIMIKYNIFKDWAKSYFEDIGPTDFEIKLRRAASFWFVVEFLYAAFLNSAALFLNVAPEESLWRAMQASGLFDPFPIYHWTLIIVTVYFTVLIFVNSIRDLNHPDQRTITSLTDREKRELVKNYKPSKFDPF